MLEDIKPDNVLLNFDAKGTRIVEAKLADCGGFSRLFTSTAVSQGLHYLT